MPAKSKQQYKWLFTDDAKKKLGEAGVLEWISKTKDPKKLPTEKKS